MLTNGPLHPSTIIQAFQQGEEKAFDFIFRKYYHTLCYFAGIYIKDPEETRDLVQDCYIKLWERHARMESIEGIKSFLYTMVRNQCIDSLRRKKTSNNRLTEFIYLHQAWESTELNEVVYSETIRKVHAAIQALPTKMQQVLNMHFLEGKKLHEIATEMNTSYDAIRQQRKRGLTLLKRKLFPILIFLVSFL